MLALWMFGTELERIWGTRYFLKFYFVTGIGAGVLTVLFSLLPFGVRAAAVAFEHHRRVGRDLRAAARLRDVLPGPPDLHVLGLPDSREVLRDDHGAIAFYSSSPRRSGVANATHLGGLLVGYLFLKSATHPPDVGTEIPLSEVEDQPRRASKFDVYIRRARGRLGPPRPLTEPEGARLHHTSRPFTRLRHLQRRRLNGSRIPPRANPSVDPSTGNP